MSRTYDKIIPGKRYGCITTIKRSEDIEQASDIRAAWWVKCDCGKVLVMINRNIKRRINRKKCSKTCGNVNR
jgi:hypothetical protein